MKLPFNKTRFLHRFSRLLACSFFVLGSVYDATATTIARSDILLHIVNQCVDSRQGNYCGQCTLPRQDALCNLRSTCQKTTEVWAFNLQYAAIRDIKMCGCTADFVHGLAMPRELVTGVEDARRPEGIWQFAWDVAATKIEPESIALVVNPQSQRSQNQLHIHILRLEPNVRQKWSQYAVAHAENLEHIWSIAADMAKKQRFIDYGVLVSQESPDHYVVIVMPTSPEAALTTWNCQSYPLNLH